MDREDMNEIIHKIRVHLTLAERNLDDEQTFLSIIDDVRDDANEFIDKWYERNSQ